MGIDIEGGMLVGRHGSEISAPDDCEESLYDWVEGVGMESYAEYYDADEEDTFYGFEIPDVPVSEMDGAWRKDLNEKAAKFKELTGLEAHLIGTQRVW